MPAPRMNSAETVKYRYALCAAALFHEDGPQLPNIALANDLWFGFGSAYVYEVKATYVEILAASPCCISLICFVLQAEREGEHADGKEQKYSKPVYRNVFGEKAFMQRQRTAARGNATMFLMPLGDILAELKRMEAEDNVMLPRNVAEIKNVVKIILKSSGALPASLITTATIRREVVVALIEEEHKRGHPLYKMVDMVRVRAKANADLPENGPINGIEQQRPHDDTLDKILVQKSASPHLVAANAEEALEHTRPSVIVQEKSAQYERDELRTQVSSWESVAKQLFGEEMVITTGSEMQPTIVSDFLPKSHPFVHKAILACE